MLNIDKIFITLLLFSIQSSIKAQAPVKKIGINTLSFRTEKKAIIRWVLDDAKQWRYAITKGFNIERADGNSNKFIKLNKKVILPISAAQLSKYDSNSFVFDAMNLLLTKPNSKEASGSKDNLLYNIYFLRSSYETEAMVQSASAFVDTTIEKGKTYTYRVKVANTTIKQTVGTIFIGEKNLSLPKSPKLNAVYGDRIVSLNWNIKEVSDDYFATILERSTDSIEFKRVGFPYIKVLDKGESSEDSATVKTTDIIPNNTKFYYRIKGVHISGLHGEPSNVVSWISVTDSNATSQIKSIVYANKNKLTIGQPLPYSQNDVVSKYHIYKSTKTATLFGMIDGVKN